MLVADEAAARAMTERIPPERRAIVHPITPARGAEILAEYVEAGFAGFTFSDATMRTREAIGLGAELIALLRGPGSAWTSGPREIRASA